MLEFASTNNCNRSETDRSVAVTNDSPCYDMLSNCYNEPFRNSRHNCLLHVLDMDESKSFRELENPSRVQWLNHLQASDEDQKEKWFRKRVKFTECQCLASLGEILRSLFPDQDRYGDSNCSSDVSYGETILTHTRNS
ncbi:hypothetical protein CDAR_239391 [Caerostris darwini]|uniref:Uncharacterized protein n=1 Tax=Caerostris darwini TaxID=1538125 RepID=A0AAV4SSP6_9ARAC|nr:hypothetical protein CDAR_239391 [Caerostris darwini]